MPYAYAAKMKDADEAERVAEFVRRFGVEVRVLHEHSALVLPCHQRMTERHVDYVSGAILANDREGCGVPGQHV